MVDQKRVLEDYLVVSAQLGDSIARTKLVELRGPRLLVHAARLTGDAEEARDIVQDAWIDIFRGLHSLRDPRAFPAWATRIVTRRCAGSIRNKQKQRTLAAALQNEAPPALSEDGLAEIDAENIRQAITALPPEQSSAVALFYLEDMGVAEVAVALDIPIGTVKTRLMHARKKLKTALSGGSDE